MQRIVDEPVGTFIASHYNGDFQFRWFQGHVYGFSRQYSKTTIPVPTEKWEMIDYGPPDEAKAGMNESLQKRIDEVCK